MPVFSCLPSQLNLVLEITSNYSRCRSNEAPVVGQHLRCWPTTGVTLGNGIVLQEMNVSHTLDTPICCPALVNVRHWLVWPPARPYYLILQCQSQYRFSASLLIETRLRLRFSHFISFHLKIKQKRIKNGNIFVFVTVCISIFYYMLQHLS